MNMYKVKLINSELKTVQCVFPTACGNSVLYLTKEPECWYMPIFVR